MLTESKIKAIRLLMRLEWYLNNGSIRGSSNYKIFIEILQDTKILGDKEIEISEFIES